MTKPSIRVADAGWPLMRSEVVAGAYARKSEIELPETTSVEPCRSASIIWAEVLESSSRVPFWSDSLPGPIRRARTGAPALRAAIPTSDDESVRSPAAIPSPPARPKIQRSSNELPGAITAPEPGSVGDSGSMRTREVQEAVGTGTRAVRNWAAGAAVWGRTRTHAIEPSGSNNEVLFALCDPVVAVQEAGETTRTPKDMPLRSMPWIHPEAVSTVAPSRKWQIQS